MFVMQQGEKKKNSYFIVLLILFRRNSCGAGGKKTAIWPWFFNAHNITVIYYCSAVHNYIMLRVKRVLMSDVFKWDSTIRLSYTRRLCIRVPRERAAGPVWFCSRRKSTGEISFGIRFKVLRRSPAAARPAGRPRVRVYPVLHVAVVLLKTLRCGRLLCFLFSFFIHTVISY